MSGDNCLVCASDEGVFVDVEKQSELKDKAKNCRLDKVWEESETTKVCYKCAFEIDQCSVFVQKVKRASRTQNAKKDSCVLCFNTQTNDIYLFDLSKQKNGVNGLIQRLKDQFSDELKNKELKKQFICLSCRYCVDLLADLRTLLEEVPSKLKSVLNNDVDPADLPKTKTIIASRKTTYIQSSDLHLNTPSDTESDTSFIMGSKRKANKKGKSSQSLPKCGQCKKAFNNDVDRYRLFKTKKALCKQCWLSFDFNKTASTKKRKKVNYPKTPLCAIVLKDLYQPGHDDEYTITEDKDGNTIFKITSTETSNVQYKESDDNEGKTVKSQKSKGRQRQDSEKSVDEEDTNEPSKTIKQRRDSEQSEHKEEDATTEPSTTSRQRKDSEQSELKKDISAKSSKTTRQRKDSEQSVQEEEETSVKSFRTTRLRIDSEQSYQEEETSVKPSRTTRRRIDSEQSVQEEEETSVKSFRTTRRRKDSEQSIQEGLDIKPTRATRGRKDSEQSIQEVLESGPVRSGRRRKESEQSVQEDIEVKSTRSRNRKNSEQSVQSVEVKASSGSKRKDSEKSDQEEVEIDIDIESDSGPTYKKIKKSNEKAESVQKSKVHNQSAASASKRKRGRSSSIESTDSVRKSARNAKKHSQALEEIIEIDDDISDTDKTEQEFTRPKRSRKENRLSYDERSDVESDKDESKKNSPMSSREPTPERKSPSPLKKETEDSINVEVEEAKTNKAQSSRKEFESSESEEIDILKSTDEESKHDESLEKGNVCKIISDVEIESEHEVSNKSIDKIDDSASKAVEYTQLQDDINEDAHSDVGDKPVDRGEPEIIEENIKEKSVEKVVVEAEENEDNDVNVSKDKSDVEDQDLSDDGKENKAISRRRTSKTNARKTKSTGGKNSKKSKIKSLDEISNGSSDSEQDQPAHEPIVTTYKCKVCEQVFDNKLEGLQHEITHAKCLKVSLEKVAIPEKRKSNVSNEIEEKMDIDENTEVADETENDEDMDKGSESEILSKQNENGNVEMAEVNDKAFANQIVDFDKIETVNEDEHESDKATEHNESETEITPNKRGRRASRRQSSRMVEEKREKKTRGRRKTTNDIPEPEVTTAVIEAEPDKIAEAVQETLNDMAELHERIREESASQDQEEEEVTIENQESEKENENTEEKQQEIISNDEPEIETIEHIVESGSETEAVPSQNADERGHEIETHDVTDDSSRDEVICDSNAESRDVEQEPEEPEHPVVDLDDEASGDVVDVENEAKKHSEESEVEITEVEDVEIEGENVEPDEIVECEQVDLTEKDDTEDVLKAVDDDDDDNDIQEIEQEPKRNIHEDENTVDSVTEINVTSAAEPTVENDAENPKHNDDTDNTEDEVLAQESLEDILERKGLQVVDEFAESVTDGDDDSEKDANISSEKENTPIKKTDNDLQSKVSESECTEIVEISNNKSPSKKSVIGEVQITQDVDVVEEVVNDDDDDVQPQNDVVEEVEVESNNGNCLKVTNNVVGEALQERKCIELETEPISDDDNDILEAEHLGQGTREARNSKDMPSLDPICEDTGDE